MFCIICMYVKIAVYTYKNLNTFLTFARERTKATS